MFHRLHGLFVGCSSESSEDSTYSTREHYKSTTRTSEPCRPVFKGAQARARSQSNNRFWTLRIYVILMCQLLTYVNKTVTRLCQIKGVMVIFWTTLTAKSEPTFLICEPREHSINSLQDIGVPPSRNYKK